MDGQMCNVPTKKCYECKKLFPIENFKNMEGKVFSGCVSCLEKHRSRVAKKRAMEAPEGTKLCLRCLRFLELPNFERHDKLYEACNGCAARRQDRDRKRRASAPPGTQWCRSCSSYRASDHFLTNKGVPCVTCQHCRDGNLKRVREEYESNLKKVEEGVTEICSLCIKLFPHEVGPKGKPFKTCRECRESQLNRGQQRREIEEQDGKPLCRACLMFREPEAFLREDGGRSPKCQGCRKSRKARNEKKRAAAPAGYIWCPVCETCKSRDDFLTHDGTLRTRCQECYKRERQYHKNPIVKLRTIKQGALQRKLLFELEDEYAIALMHRNCFFCGRQGVAGSLNGIDRLCSKSHYTTDNCVPCCRPCNFAKGCLDPTTFVKRVVMLHAIAQGHTDINTCPEVWGWTTSGTFGNYRYHATSAQREFNLTKENFMQLTASPCVWCRRPSGVNSGRHGLDRVDNDKGYRVDNVASCCRECNYMRGKLSCDQFKELMALMAPRAESILASLPVGIKECLRVQRLKKR